MLVRARHSEPCSRSDPSAQEQKTVGPARHALSLVEHLSHACSCRADSIGYQRALDSDASAPSPLRRANGGRQFNAPRERQHARTAGQWSPGLAPDGTSVHRPLARFGLLRGPQEAISSFSLFLPWPRRHPPLINGDARMTESIRLPSVGTPQERTHAGH